MTKHEWRRNADNPEDCAYARLLEVRQAPDAPVADDELRDIVWGVY